MLHTELGSPWKRHGKMNQVQTRACALCQLTTPPLWKVQAGSVRCTAYSCYSMQLTGRVWWRNHHRPLGSMLKICRWLSDLCDNFDPTTSCVTHQPHDASRCRRVVLKFLYTKNHIFSGTERGHVSAFSYMERQTNNSGLMAKLYMERQTKSRERPCLGTKDKETKMHITQKLLVGFLPNSH